MGDHLGTPGAAGAPHSLSQCLFPGEFRKLCMGGVKERNCSKNPSGAISEANADTSAMYGRKAGFKISGDSTNYLLEIAKILSFSS